MYRQAAAFAEGRGDTCFSVQASLPSLAAKGTPPRPGYGIQQDMYFPPPKKYLTYYFDENFIEKALYR